MQLQCVPPHMHQINSTERSVRTFKKHFIVAILTVEPHSPFYLWDHLLPQVTMTLNMVQKPGLNPALSSYKQVYGVHNFE